MNKTHQIIAIRLAALFSENYNFDLVQIEAQTGNILLTQPKHPRYPFIKIILNSVNDTQDNASEMVRSINNLNRIKRDLNLLTFSFVDETQERPDHQIINLSQENIFSQEVLNHFPSIKNLSWLINDVQQDLQQAVNRINQAALKNRKTRQRQRLFTGSKGALIVIAINILMYLLGMFITSIAEEPTTYMIALGGIYVPFIQGAYEILRFIMAGFVHASPTHLLFNMLSLYNISVLLEKVYGTKRFIMVLLVSVIGGNLFVYIADTQAALSVGLSTGIYGLLGLLIVYLFESQLIKAPMLRNQLIWIIGINLMINFLPNISWLGHLGGFVTGVFAGIIISRKPTWQTFKKNVIIASIIATLFSGYLAINRPRPQNYYVLSDLDVISVWRKLGVNFYADYLEERLSYYYLIEGEGEI
jgi:membrane associated rhomboid family serine protease